MYIIDRYYHTKKKRQPYIGIWGPYIDNSGHISPNLDQIWSIFALKCIKHFIRLTNCYSYSITTKSWVWKLEKYIFYTILRCYLKIFGWFFKLCVHLITLRERWCLTLWLSKSRDWVLFFFSGFNWKFRIMLLPLSSSHYLYVFLCLFLIVSFCQWWWLCENTHKKFWQKTPFWVAKPNGMMFYRTEEEFVLLSKRQMNICSIPPGSSPPRP